MSCDTVARIVTMIAALTCIAACSTDEPPEPVDQTLAGVFRLVKVDSKEPTDLGGPDERFMPGNIEETYSGSEITGLMVLDGERIFIDIPMPQERIYVDGIWRTEWSDTYNESYFHYSFVNPQGHQSFRGAIPYGWEGDVLKIQFGMFSRNIQYVLYWKRLSNC